MVCIYAVVLGFSSPNQNKRGDWMMTATLVDEGSFATPTTLIMFCKEAKDLPKLTRMGDVLRMHRVSLQVRRMVAKKKDSLVLLLTAGSLVFPNVCIV
jgi:hypothetical protein